VKVKDEILAELDRVQGRQRDTTSQMQASENQLARLETMFKQLDARRSQVVFAERKADGGVPSQPVAVPGSEPDVTVPSPPAVVLSISRTRSERTTQRPCPIRRSLASIGCCACRQRAGRPRSIFVGVASSVRVDGELQELDGEPVLVPRDVESLLLTLMPERNHEVLRTGAATEWCATSRASAASGMSFRDHRGAASSA
jgi:hypothetical protein